MLYNKGVILLLRHTTFVVCRKEFWQTKLSTSEKNRNFRLLVKLRENENDVILSIDRQQF